MKRFLCCMLLVCLFLGVTVQAKADYIFTTFDVYVASGINDSGQIVGAYGAGGFLYSGGTYTTINVPTPDRLATTDPHAINNAGHIVGAYFSPNADNRFHGFLLSDGRYTLFDPPGSDGTAARGINNAGQICGNYRLGNAGLGFLLSGGSYTPLSVPGSTSTGAFGINDHGHIVGDYLSASGRYHGFLLSGSSYTTIDVPGSADTHAAGINNAGDIVGVFGQGQEAHGFLLNAGSYTTIDVPGSTFTEILGINNAGQIVGFYLDAGGNQHAFLGSPVPEPATLLLVGISTLGLIWWAWRGRIPRRYVSFLATPTDHQLEKRCSRKGS